MCAETASAYTPPPESASKGKWTRCKLKVRLDDRQILSGRDMKASLSFTSLSKNQRPLIHFRTLLRSNVQSLENVGEKKIHYASHCLHAILAVSRLFGQIHPFSYDTCPVSTISPSLQFLSSGYNSFKNTISNRILWSSCWKTLLYIANIENASTRDCVLNPED